MKRKMQTISGPVIIDSNEVTQFYPDHESGGELTAVEYLADGGRITARVRHSFYQVAAALAGAWRADDVSKSGG
ncbi:hypothetical protein ACSFS0_004547 [Escherichia coli]